MYKVSIIIISFNGKDLALQCLESLERQTYTDFEIILVDNGSSDGTLEAIQDFLQEGPLSGKVRPFRLDVNNGVTGGYSEGLQHAHSEYVALLNNDTEPRPDWLKELVEAMDSDCKTGICGSKMIVHGTDIIDSAGDGLSTALKGFKRGEGGNISCYLNREFIFGACAGAALYRGRMLEEIGFFDKDFFLLFEDIDLSFRAQLTGWKVLNVPTAVVSHKVRSSIGTMSDTAIYYAVRNVEFVRIKNIPFGIFVRFFPGLLLGTAMDFLYFAVKHKKPALYLKAKKDALRMLPNMLKKRKELMKKKKVSNAYIMSLMTSVWQSNFFKSKVKKFIYG